MWITNAHLIGTDAALAVPQTSQVHLRFDEQYRLAEISAKMPQHGPVPRIDFQGDFVSLGGVDLQINGALGLAFPDLSEAHGAMLEKIGAFLWTQGIDAYAPTLVTTASSKVQTALAVLAAYRPRQSLPQAAILGAHLEGPCLNPAKRGAHPESFLQPLTQPVLQDLLGEFGNQVCIVTLAPELDPTGTTIAYLRSQQIVVSLGHSLATDLEAEQAFAQGATMVTHACNAMPPLHHREPGLLATALLDQRVWCGVIADGQHVAPRMLQLLLSIQPHQLFLVSDALAPLGLPDGLYPWDTRQIQVHQGTARLPDGTLSGTTRPLLAGVSNLVKWGCCTPEQAIALAVVAPRRAMGLAGLAIGTPLSSLLRWTYQDTTRQLDWQRLSLGSGLSPNTRKGRP